MTERRTDPPEVKVEEHGTALLREDQLTDKDVRLLKHLQGKGRLTLQRTRHGWRLRTHSVTGVLLLDGVRLTLRPKLPIAGEQLITWLCYANGVPVPHEPTLRRWRTSSTGYADVVLPALLAECQTLLRRGLNRGYQQTERVEPTLRGRLDIHRQIVRRYGAVDRLHVRTFERDLAIWENQICGAALAAAVPLAAGRPALAGELETAAARFPRPHLGATVTRLLRRARYTRLNEHYRAAHVWSALVLGGGGVSDLLAHRGTHAGSVLLHLDRLWELVVRRMAADAAHTVDGRLARPEEGRIQTFGGLGRSDPSFRPDTLLAFDNTPETRFLTIDAKHKALQSADVGAPDRHQLLTYIAGYTTPAAPTAVIVHPAHDGSSHRTLRIQGPRGLLGVIDVLGLDTRLPPRQAAEPLRTLIADFAAGTL
ncbi:PE-PGRS family protein [Kitasatospora sp. NPDC056783]|uniref:5-methylcytosine restriction system specificity protein McrC n=1 Tax=Kitasatospora sp. NPDC056783 TaxID=3345943 RepID=UPI003674A359